MDILSRLKGSLAQAVVKAAFSHWNYRVVPFGVEETLREVTSLDLEQYRKLKLPVTLRSAPDFIVASLDMSFAHLVEVKFRSKWSDVVRKNCRHELQRQVKHWGPITVVFVFRNFHDAGPCVKCLSLDIHKIEGNRENHLEVVTANNGTKDWNEVTEADFRDLSEVFPSIATNTSEFRSALASLVSVNEVFAQEGAQTNLPVLEKEVSTGGNCNQLQIRHAQRFQPRFLRQNNL